MDINELFAGIYQFFYDPKVLSDGLYFNDDYMIIGITTIIFSLLIPVIYYYGINHPRFNQQKHWGLIIFIGAFFVFAITWWFVDTEVQILQLDNVRVVEIVFFSAVNVLIYLIVTFISSILLKLKSINCSKTPF